MIYFINENIVFLEGKIMKIRNIFHLDNIKLQKKLLLSYVFLVLLPIIISGFFLVYRTIRTTLDYTSSINQISFLQMKSNVTNMLDGYIKLADSIPMEKRLMDYVGNPSGVKDYFIKYNDYVNIYTEYSIKFPIAYGDLVKMSIYTTNDTIQWDDVFIIAINNNIRTKQWYKDVCSAHGRSIFLEPSVKDGINFISIGKQLNPFATGQYTNVVLLDIPETELYKVIEKEGINKKVYILNDNNIVVSSTQRDIIGKSGDTVPDLSRILVQKPVDGLAETDIDKNTALCGYITQDNAIRNWKVISIASNAPMLRSVSSNLTYSVLVCCLSVVVTVIFVVFLSRTLTSRLKMLVRNMSNIRDGKFDVFVKFEGNDEISELYVGFKSMVERINNLIYEVYMLDIEKKDAKIKALQSQINPHFLFNTMESVRMNLWNRQDYETSEIIQKFAKLLRKSIEWGSGKITLFQEVDLVETYLRIQQYRYKEKLSYEINIDPNLYSYIIPKFILQPIVENAIYHGIEMKKGNGCLTIYSEDAGNDIRIIVEDDGVGIDESRLAELRELLRVGTSGSPDTRIGIINVHQRIQFFYGIEYGITIESILRAGTKVQIVLPKQNV